MGGEGGVREGHKDGRKETEDKVRASGRQETTSVKVLVARQQYVLYLVSWQHFGVQQDVNAGLHGNSPRRTEPCQVPQQGD